MKRTVGVGVFSHYVPAIVTSLRESGEIGSGKRKKKKNNNNNNNKTKKKKKKRKKRNKKKKKKRNTVE